MVVATALAITALTCAYRRMWNSVTRRLGILSAWITVALIAVYVPTLIVGLVSIRSPLDPIGDPWFSVLEILIILLMPVMIALAVAVHAWSSPKLGVFGLLGVIFMAMMGAVTCSLHFVILTVGRQGAFEASDSMPLLLSFHWPSVAYALDNLAWDVYFALAVLFMSTVFGGSKLGNAIRGLLVLSGVLALAGLSGVALNDMNWRNIGILGYAGVFPIAALLMAILFTRTPASG